MVEFRGGCSEVRHAMQLEISFSSHDWCRLGTKISFLIPACSMMPCFFHAWSIAYTTYSCVSCRRQYAPCTLPKAELEAVNDVRIEHTMEPRLSTSYTGQQDLADQYGLYSAPRIRNPRMPNLKGHDIVSEVYRYQRG